MLSRRGFVVSGIAVGGGLVLGYAIYNATGQRIRTLPVSKAP